MSSHVIDGFVKAAGSAEWVGGGLGAAAGAFLARNGSWGQRLSGVAMGAGMGGALGLGVEGLIDDPNFSDLTPGEVAVMREEAAEGEKWRNALRLVALGGGLAGAVAFRSPLPLLTSLPAATIAPIGQEASRLKRMAKDFRGARRSS